MADTAPAAGEPPGAAAGGPAGPPAAPRTPPGDAAVALRWVLLAVPVGLLAGVVWWRVAPRVPLVVAGGDAYPQEYQPRGYLGADAAFLLVTVLAGAAATAAGLARHRGRPVGLLVGGAAGGLVGSALAWALGARLGAVDLAAAVGASADGTVLDAPLGLRATGVLLGWALVAVAGVAADLLWDALRGRDG